MGLNYTEAGYLKDDLNLFISTVDNLLTKYVVDFNSKNRSSKRKDGIWKRLSLSLNKEVTLYPPGTSEDFEYEDYPAKKTLKKDHLINMTYYGRHASSESGCTDFTISVDMFRSGETGYNVEWKSDVDDQQIGKFRDIVMQDISMVVVSRMYEEMISPPSILNTIKV